MSAVDPSLIERIIRDDVRAMGAYHVADSHGLVKLDAMENPYRLPPELRAQLAARGWRGRPESLSGAEQRGAARQA
jgi:histidinol-phosphate aminotransferase